MNRGHRGFRYHGLSVLAWLGSLLITMLVQGQPSSLRFEPIDHSDITGGMVFFREIMQDSRGFLWLGTERGLLRYDGYAIKAYLHDPDDPFSAPGNVPFDMAEDPQGMLWIAFNQEGLARMDPASGTFHKIPHHLGEKLTILYVSANDNGEVWVSSAAQGIFKVNHQTQQLEPFPLPPNLYQPSLPTHRRLFVDQKGWLWFISDKNKLIAFDSHTKTQQPTPFDEKTALDMHPIDGKDILKIKTDENLYYLDTATNQARPLLTPAQQRRLQTLDSIGYWHVDRRNILWFTVPKTDGLFSFNLNNNRWMHHTHQPTNPLSIPADVIHHIYEDRSGVMWFGTVYGARKLVPLWEDFEMIPFSEGASTAILSMTEDRQGNLLAASFCGALFTLKPSSQMLEPLASQYPALKAVEPECFMTLHVTRDDLLWMGGWPWQNSAGGLHRLDRNTGQLKTYLQDPEDPSGLPSNAVRALYEDRSGRFWVGSEVGLSLMDRTTERFTTYLHQPDDSTTLGSSIVWFLLEDRRDRFWVGTYGGGLNRFDRETGKATRFLSDPENKRSLSSNTISFIHESQKEPDILWIGTYDGGLNQFDTVHHTATRFTQQDGLPSNYVKAILEDEQGLLWISTDNGLSQFNPVNHTIKTYSEADGMSDQFGLMDALRRRDGTFVFGSNGLVRFRPEAMRTRRYAPPLTLTSFQVFDQERPLPSTSQGLKLPWKDNVLSFEFAALDFSAPGRIQYAYQLEGFNEDWVPLGHQRFVMFTNLDPGKYVFRVKSTNSNGVWSDHTLDLPLTIVPPFWMTWWFQLVLGLAGVGLIAFVVRTISTRKLRREVRALEMRQKIQSERERISRDLHDHVGAQLSNMISLAELIQLSQRAERPDQMQSYLASLDEDARLAMTQLRETIWALQKDRITPDDFLSHVDDFARRSLRHRSQPTLHLTRQESYTHHLSPEQALNLFRIVQEGITNTLKHAEARQLFIALNEDEKTGFVLTIRDDGTFVAPRSEGNGLHGHGLANMRRRAEDLGGSLTLTAPPGQGTTLQVTLPTLATQQIP